MDAEAGPLCSLPDSRGPRGRGPEASTPAGSHRWPVGWCWLRKRHLSIQGPTGGSSPDTATVRGWPRASPQLPPWGVQGRHGPFSSHNEPKMFTENLGWQVPGSPHGCGQGPVLRFSLGLSPSVQPPAATRWQCWIHPAHPPEAPGRRLTRSLSPFLPQKGSACVLAQLGPPTGRPRSQGDFRQRSGAPRCLPLGLTRTTQGPHFGNPPSCPLETQA